MRSHDDACALLCWLNPLAACSTLQMRWRHQLNTCRDLKCAWCLSKFIWLIWYLFVTFLLQCFDLLVISSLLFFSRNNKPKQIVSFRNKSCFFFLQAQIIRKHFHKIFQEKKISMNKFFLIPWNLIFRMSNVIQKNCFLSSELNKTWMFDWFVGSQKSVHTQ